MRRLLLIAVTLWPFLVYAQDSPNSGEIQEIRSLLREASALIPKIEKFQQGSAAANTASLQARAGDFEAAFATAKIAPDATTQTVAYALADQGNVQAALAYVAASGTDKTQTSGYSEIARLLSEKEDFPNAVRAARLVPDNRDFPFAGQGRLDTLAYICADEWKAGKTSEASAILNEILDAALEKASGAAANSDTVGFYTSIVQRLAAAGDREDAVSVLNLIYPLMNAPVDRSLKFIWIGDLANAQASVGNFSSALQTAQDLPEGQDRDDALNLIVAERVRQGDLVFALDEAQNLSVDFLRQASLLSIANEQTDRGQSASSLSTIDLIPAVADRAHALAQLALHQADLRDPQADYTIQLAIETAHSGGTATKPFVFESIAVALGLRRRFGEAIAIVDELDNDSRVWPLWNLTGYMTTAGKKDDALSLARRQDYPQARAYALLGVAGSMLRHLKKKEESH